MDDSWQKLMGIDCGSDDGPSSPVFHKKKWVVLPTSLKRSGSEPLLTKHPKKKLKNKRENDSKTRLSVQVLDRNSTMPPEDKSLENSTVEEEDPLLIYSTTPTKNYKHKRKTIDLLSCSLRSEVSFSKKSKLVDENHAELSKDSSDIKFEKSCNELGEETEMPTSVKFSPIPSNKTNLSPKSSTSKPQRKLLYSFNEESNLNLKTPNVTVNDIIKSVIMIDVADIHSSPKKNRQPSFIVQFNDFLSVTSLTNENLKDYPKQDNDLSSPPSNALEKCNDSFGECMFTEVENECLNKKNICLNSDCNKVPLTSDCFEIPDDRNPMDETFSNYRFTEIEEDYACFNRQGLKDISPVTSSIKSAVEGTVCSYSSPQNNMGRNACSKLEQEDIITNKLTCHKSTQNKIVEANVCALDNERDKILLDGNGSEDSYIKPCGDDKDIFNSTISSPKSITTLEMVTDKELFLSTSKECFNDLDDISTEEFRNNQLANQHHELNSTLKEDVLNQSTENPEKDLLNKSVSKLDVTLTDIMQRLINKNISSNRSSNFNGLKQEIIYKEESKNNELCNQTLGNISSECIPEPSNLLGTNETGFLTQEYLENVKPEVSLDTSVVYYQQSFDYMISAEVKSRLSGNNFAVPPVEQEPSLLNRSLSSEICIMADDEDRSPNNSLVYNYKNIDLNESNASNLNESMIGNSIKSPICSDNLNNSYDIKLTQCEHTCNDPVVNRSPGVTSGLGVREKPNDVEKNSDKIHNEIKKFPNRTPSMTGVSALNSDLISQGSLQQFNYSFRLERDDLDFQKKKNDSDNQGIEDIDINNVYSNCSTSSMMTAQNIKISQECLRNYKSRGKDNVVRDRSCYEDSGVLLNNNNADSLNLKNLSSDKFVTEYNEHSTNSLSEIKKLNHKQLPHCLKSGTENSIHCKINNDVQKTAQLDHPVLLQKPCGPLTHQKSNADHSSPSASGKNNNTSKESVVSHDLMVTNQDNFQQCVPDSHITSLNFQTEKNSICKMDLTKSSSSFNTISKNIDDSRSGLNDIEENELKIDKDFTFKSPLAMSFKVDNLMFSSAGGKKIQVSQNALAKVKSMFNEILEVDPRENKDTEEKSVINQVCKTSVPSSCKSSDFLFSSANCRNITVSDDMKSNISKIPESHTTGYGSSVDKKDTNESLEGFISCLSKDDNFMFSSASGKKITSSDDALFKVKSKYNEILESSSMEVDRAEAKVNTVPNIFVSGPLGNDNLSVPCSHGSNIKYLEDEFAKDKSKFDGISERYLAEDKIIDNKSYMNQIPKTSIPGSRKNYKFLFSTAGGKNIKVSDVALAKIKSKFNDIMEIHETEAIKDIAETDNHQETKPFSPILSKKSNFIFSSASAKDVEDSGEPSVQMESESNRILENNLVAKKHSLDKTTNPCLKTYSKPNEAAKFTSSNVNNKNVLENAVALVNSKLNDNFERRLNEFENAETKSDRNQAFKTSLPVPSKSDSFMFSTAGEKNIAVSEVALANVKSKFDEIMDSFVTGYEKTEDIKNIDRESKNSLPISSKSDCFMFSSGGGKNIQVSEISTAKVKSEVFQSSLTDVDFSKAERDINQAPKISLSNSSKAGISTFASVCGTNIEVSDDALARVKAKFNEIMESNEDAVVKNKTEANIDRTPKTTLPSSGTAGNIMFSSASGKNITVSDDALAKVKAKYNEIMESHEDVEIKDKAEKNIQQHPKTILNSYGKTSNFMFSSASGNCVNVSENALAKVKSKFKEIMESQGDAVVKNKTEANIDRTPKTSLPSSGTAGNFMFSSASGKNITVSDDALAKVKAKYNEIMESNEDVEIKDKAEKNIHQQPKTILNSSGKTSNFMFSSASGNCVNVSENALAKVKSKFKEIMESNEDAVVKNKTETNIDLTPKTTLPSSGTAGNFMFSSASGKNITVSDDALAKVKAKYNEIMESHEDVELKDKAEKNIDQKPKTVVNSSGKTSNFMFSSASGNCVNVSENALAKVKLKLNEVIGTAGTFPTRDETDSKEASKKYLPYSSKTNDFMLSIGENVKVSDDSASKDKAKSNIGQTPKASFSSSGIAVNFMFSSASGKNITVSDDALAKVKSKFNEILNSSLNEVKGTETEAGVKLIPESFLTGSEKADNLKSTIGNSTNVSNIASAESKPKLYDLSGNNLIEGESDNIEMNDRQLLETTLSCFDKSDPFSLSIDETKTAEIPDVILDEKELNKHLKDNATQIVLNQSRNVLDKLINYPIPIINKNDSSFPFPPDFNSNNNVVDETLPHRNKPENFICIPKNNEIESQNIPYTFSEVKFSTARGKDIGVSEDALLKVRSKFSELMDSKSMHLSNAGNSDDNFFRHANSPNKIFSDEVCFDPVLNEIEGCLAQTPKNSHLFSKECMNEKISNSLNQNDKKSKSSHSGHSVSDQPLAKKVCFQPGIVNVTDKSEQTILEESKMQGFTFTQSISQSVLDKEIDIIEGKKCPRKLFNLNDNESNSKPDECLENKYLVSDKRNTQSKSEEGDMTMIYEVSDSAAAFMADCTPDRSMLSSPSSFFNRKSMKPMKLLEMEFDDVDDEIMVAAELKIIPEQIMKNPFNKVSTNATLDSINFRSCSIELLSIRNDQRKRIDEIINQKLKQRPLSSPGLYMALRNGGSLKRISENLQPFLDQEQLCQLGIKEEILCINSINAEKFEFCAESFFSYEECFSTKGIIDIGYGFSLILSDDNKVGLIELSRCFLSNPNVDPSLVSSAWIKNHFKWIVWKLACYERLFPKHLANRSLTPDNVLHQLKYRYDREIDLAQRPAIKKILECDEPSTRRLIACVADIRNVDSSDAESNYEIELTDGWYSVLACIDPAMKILIDRKKVKIGTKLIFQAAELLNCTEGCDPLEIASSVRLKLHTNCIRRVKWHTKMGFTRNPGPIRVPLNSILHNGGFVGLTSAIIARVYPLLYMSKDADGKTVLRNAHAEHHASNLKENDLTIKSEELFEKLFPEVEAKYKSGVVKFDKNSITKIKDPSLLWKIVSNESDPTEVQSLMAQDQLLEVRKYHELISSKIREEVQAVVKKKLEELLPSQKAKCLLKLRLLDTISGSNALLTVWNPSEDLLQILVEKKYFDFYALNASGTRDKVLHLSSTSRTIYKEKNLSKPIKEYERKVTTIHDIVANSVSAQFGEMDVVGIVIFIKEPEKPWGVTNVYLSDSKESFLMITFWTSLKTFGCDDTLKPGSTVACINLQWRQGSGSYVIPSTYANEMTYFSTNPNQEYLIKAFQEIKSSISSKNLEHFIMERRRILFTILKEREYNSKTPISRVETPKVLKRLENLKKYGEASPLPKLSLLSSPDIHRKFRSPKSGGS